MPISADRIKHDLTTIAGFTETPGAGSSRPTFSQPWRQARDYIASQLEAIGCKTRIDAAGNLHARPSAISWDAPAWLSGSHVDSVPHGGDFDGVVGVITPLEVMRAAREDLKIAVPLELVVWAEEEGTTFGLGMLGSRAFVGDLSAEQLAKLKNKSGQNYFEAGQPHGVMPEKIATDRLKAGTVIGLVEVHIEQGPRLWNQDIIAATVTAIAARRQYRGEMLGVANHAGSTSMEDRHDALAGVAEIIVALEKLAHEIGRGSVITVGQITAHPNAVNVINDKVNFTIDFRSPHMELLAGGDQSIHKLLMQIADRRSLKFSLELTESQAAVEMDARICNKMRKAAATCKVDPIDDAVSGALHDAAILAPHVPTAMLFIPSRDGISHNAEEFSRVNDIVAAARILMETVRDRRLE